MLLHESDVVEMWIETKFEVFDPHCFAGALHQQCRGQNPVEA